MFAVPANVPPTWSTARQEPGLAEVVAHDLIDNRNAPLFEPVPTSRTGKGTMIFRETELRGVCVVEVEELTDVRGFFARTWCKREFEKQGLATRMVQASVSYNKRKGTLRGMHYQAYPSEEARLVRCTRGATFDAVVDLRPHSPTFLRHLSLTLTAENHTALYVPPGCALGFQTLEDQTEVFYQMSTFYAPPHARGFRWNDPAFGIQWPDDHRIILDRDRAYPDFDEDLVADLRHHTI